MIIILVGTVFLGCSSGEDDTVTLKQSDYSVKAKGYEGIQTCNEGELKARKHIKEGKLRMIFGKFGSRQSFPKKLNELYGVEIIYVEGVIGIPNDCYNNIMSEEIRKKHGQDALENAM